MTNDVPDKQIQWWKFTRPPIKHPGYAYVHYTYGNSDVISSISMPAGFRRHLVGKTLSNVCCCAVAYTVTKQLIRHAIYTGLRLVTDTDTDTGR